MKYIILILIIFFLIVVYKNQTIPKSIGIYNGKLHPCPNTPNCVNSDSNNKQSMIAPLPIVSDDPLQMIEDFLTKNYNTKIVEKTPVYLHAVVGTPFFHFHDDLQFLIDTKKNSISVRSSSRLGYTDYGTNRSRIEKIREYLINQE